LVWEIDQGVVVPAAVRIENLHFRYPVFDPDATGVGGEEPGYALAGIDLEIGAGELLGISGTTGSGKTTLCLTLNGLVPQQTSGTIRGDVWVGDWNTKRVPVPELATRVGLVFQDPEANLLGLTVEDEVAFGPENLAVDPGEIEERVTWALDVVGMTAQRRRSAALLSGGQKQRVGIAAVLAMMPQVLVLDEPTAELDPLGKREIGEVIAGLRERERGMTVVMVESDATTLVRLADRLAIMDAGSIVALDEPGALYAHPAPLIERGVPVPHVSEVALRLNQRLGRSWSFVIDDEALATFRDDLQASAG
jgi:energy-coupling factor transporter ATP-binding protein EcfA2